MSKFYNLNNFLSKKVWKKIPDLKNKPFLDKWTGSCNVGQHQSPIDIASNLVIDDDRIPAVKFQNFDKAIITTVINNGHSAQVNIPGEIKPMLSGGSLNGTYIFENLHFHWPSEHTIDEETYDLETHIVFYSTVYPDFAEASKHLNGVAVLAIFHNEIEKRGPHIFDILASAAEEVSEKVNSETNTEPIEFQDLLPSNHKPFYTYMGSLTTPKCNEVVTWIILESIGKINSNQYKSITTIYDSNHQLLSSTNRDIQPLNSRPIYYKDY